jgi:hypothetical protein
MSEISTSSHADSDQAKLWNHAIEMEDFDLARQLQEVAVKLPTQLEDEQLQKWSLVDLAAQQQAASDEWFLGPEGYAAFETSKIPPALGGAALRGERRNLWMSSIQLCADKGDWYDF